MSISPHLLQQIHHLRSKGYSVPEIHQMVGVSKSTVSRHVRAVAVSDEGRVRLNFRRGASHLRKQRDEHLAADRCKQLLASEFREQLIIAACLYWAEGNKRELTLTNTDGQLIATYLRALRVVLRVPDDRITVSLRVFEDIDIEAALRYWSSVTGISLTRDQTTISVLHGKKNGKLQYGMCRIRVRRGGLFHKILHSCIRTLSHVPL